MLVDADSQLHFSIPRLGVSHGEVLHSTLGPEKHAESHVVEPWEPVQLEENASEGCQLAKDKKGRT